MEIASLIDSRNVAFRLDSRHWISRRGCFEPASFVINPTRLELLNGILIPGHRCIPFANPALLPQDYEFYWKGSAIPATTTEGPPEEFYPYYCIFGEEYAPQYVARDNPENESAFNSDPYEDPPEVSIKTLDMRNMYRESSFVPGDRFVVKTRDWKAGIFDLERVDKDLWPQTDMYAWIEAAESGFEDSFALLGPGTSTEEQIAYAYWFGGKRMRDVPAYSLEEFLYKKTDRIETVPYGIETRFWYAGKEIPDSKELEGVLSLPDRTLLEDILIGKKIPVTEYVIQSYVRDALFRNDDDVPRIIERIAPKPIHLNEQERNILTQYIFEALEEFRKHYVFFTDQSMGPIRQRVGELHTAVIELTARLQKGDIDQNWLPKHTFIVLSQIQGHAAELMEDLDSDEAPPEAELEAMDNSLDSMIETYEDIKELIDDSLNNFRRNNLSVVKKDAVDKDGWQTVQISVSGTGAWRRVLVPRSYRLEDMHRIIQASLDWKNSFPWQFSIDPPDDIPGRKILESRLHIAELLEDTIIELLYDYGTKWTVKIMLLSPYQARKGEVVRCVAGAEAAPPEDVDGPLRFRKLLHALGKGTEAEKQDAQRELGQKFIPELFDMERCNSNLKAIHPDKKANILNISGQ
jgi:hypothetical protein